MPYRITITADANRQFRSLAAHEQRVLAAAINARLKVRPTIPTRAIKRLRPNPFADYELRTGDLRALYTVEDDEVAILLVGRKAGNRLIVEGEEFHGDQNHPAEPPGSKPPADAE